MNRFFNYVSKRSYYSKTLIDHYENPRNVGSFSNDKNVGVGLVGAPACGDVMKLSIKVDDKSNTIVDAKFKTFVGLISHHLCNLHQFKDECFQYFVM